jgi:hypothetical protein
MGVGAPHGSFTPNCGTSGRRFAARLRAMSRLSEKLLVSHYDSNYGGAVNHLNAITPQLAGPKINYPLKLP